MPKRPFTKERVKEIREKVSLLKAIGITEISRRRQAFISAYLSDYAQKLPKTLDPLLKAWVKKLAAPDPNTRVSAIYVLGASNEPHAIKPLAAMLKDSDPKVREAAKETLEDKKKYKK